MSSINVNDFVSKNFKQLSYLSWADALHIVKHLYPDFTYEIIRHTSFVEDKNGVIHLAHNLPYCYDPILGYWVEVKVTIESRIETCILPLFDSSYNSKKSSIYNCGKDNKTKVEIADTADLNYAHQRALVKCLALHGLGDYLYRGESLPSGTAEVEPEILEGQYIAEEIELLRTAIHEGRKANPQITATPPSITNIDLYKKGGDNRGYTNELMNMARQLNINPMEYLKTIPQQK